MATKYPYPVPAGSLDRRITIERFLLIKDGFNNPVKQWSTYTKLWASKMDVSDLEKLQSQEIGAEISTRFRVRWSDTTVAITPKDRIHYNGVIYDIVGIKELDRKIGFEISTVARLETSQA